MRGGGLLPLLCQTGAKNDVCVSEAFGNVSAHNPGNTRYQLDQEGVGLTKESFTMPVATFGEIVVSFVRSAGPARSAVLLAAKKGGKAETKAWIN